MFAIPKQMRKSLKKKLTKLHFKISKILHGRINGLKFKPSMTISKKVIVALDSDNLEEINKLVDVIQRIIFLV